MSAAHRRLHLGACGNERQEAIDRRQPRVLSDAAPDVPERVERHARSSRELQNLRVRQGLKRRLNLGDGDGV